MSKTKIESVKKILNETNFFFRMNCRRLTWGTGHYAWPRCSFSWSNRTCDHPSCHRTWSFLSPCHHFEGNRYADCLNDNSQIVNHCGRVGHFDDSHDISDCDADGSSIHGYVRQEDEPFSFPLAASYPW